MKDEIRFQIGFGNGFLSFSRWTIQPFNNSTVQPFPICLFFALCQRYAILEHLSKKGII
jgi:hypothetical protein